jgi:putative transposase
MKNKRAALEPDSTYHIYNRANGSEQLFASDENYRYFLQKYSEYISPFSKTFCYCLMPNHFHFIVRIKAINNLNLQGFKNLEGIQSPSNQNLEDFLSKQFSNFFNAYTKAFNKEQNRKGSLFMHTFKRKKIADEFYLKKLVHYIHFNPVEAGLAKSPSDWKYSSYNAILSEKPSLLDKNEVIEWFEDLQNFIFVHENLPRYTGIDGFSSF